MCTKRFVNISAKFWENMLTGFRFMDFMSNRHDPGKSMQRNTRPNRGKGLRVKNYQRNKPEGASGELEAKKCF